MHVIQRRYASTDVKDRLFCTSMVKLIQDSDFVDVVGVEMLNLNIRGI